MEISGFGTKTCTAVQTRTVLGQNLPSNTTANCNSCHPGRQLCRSCLRRRGDDSRPHRACLSSASHLCRLRFMPLGCAVEFDRQGDPHHWHHSCLSRTDGSSSSELQLAMHHDKLSMKEVRSSKGLTGHAHAHFKGLARRHPRSVQSRPSVCSWLGIRKSSDVPAALITRSAERRACPGVLRWALSALPSCFARVEQAACKVRIPSMPARRLCYVDGTSRNREGWRLAFCGGFVW